MKLNQLTLTEALAGIKKKEFTGREVFDDCWREIKSRDGEIHAFLDVASQDDYQERGQFHGLPLAIKDNFCTLQFQTRASSKVLDGFHAPYQATVVNKVQEAGFSFIGKNYQ